MDYHLKQWGNQQHESDHHHHHQLQHQQQQQQDPSGSALQLFVPDPEPTNNTKLSNNSNLSAFSDMSHISTPTTTASTRFPRMASSYFSLAQWQELELQALIFRYMLAGADVPDELLHPIKKSILQSHPSFNYHPLHHYPHYQSPWYWGRAAMDPEPGRCRRTDGKKWRCSRDVVAGHKYCERHMHRGRNRSRKPVETPTAPTASAPPLTTAVAAGGMSSSSHLSGPSRPSIDLFQLNQSSSEATMVENKSLFESQNENPSSGDHGRSDGKILRCFFDDWPRSLQEEPESVTGGNNPSSMTSAPSSLSMSFPGNMSSSSDISLKLSTGTLDDEPGSRGDYIDRERTQLNWATAGWGTHPVAPMGGPLAEALRSSSTTSPTSVLHELPRNSASQTSYV